MDETEKPLASLREGEDRTAKKVYIECESELLAIDGICIDLSERPLASRLIRCLYFANTKGATREELLSFVYGENDLANRSQRYTQALSMRLLKLISRTRAWLDDLTRTLMDKEVYFLPCERSFCRWYLIADTRRPVDQMALGFSNQMMARYIFLNCSKTTSDSDKSL